MTRFRVTNKQLSKCLIGIFLITGGLSNSFIVLPSEPPRESFVNEDSISIPPEERAMTSLGYREVTAYTPSPDETDDTPCITAIGHNICEDTETKVVATNELPFYTEVLIDDTVYVVLDRMNKRYTNRYDILVYTKQEAYEWGKRVKEIYKINR